MHRANATTLMLGQELLAEQLCHGDAMPWDFCTTVGPAQEHSHVGFSPSGICRLTPR